MRQITKQQKAQVIRCLVEGSSIRATARMTGVSFNSIQRLTIAMGKAAVEYQDAAINNLQNTKRVECDEMWNYVYAKDKNVPQELIRDPGVGSLWTWIAMDADNKLIISWRLGGRDAENAWYLMQDVAERLAHRVQLTTDGYRNYLEAVHSAFGNNIDYAMLIKVYGEPSKKEQARYSPAKCLGAKRAAILGNPDPNLVSTSYIERQNLNVRMQNRRYTRLTNAFSKKAEMQAYSFAITVMHHNFVRKHLTLKTTPAMAAGIADKEWTVEDMSDLIPELKYDTHPRKRIKASQS